VAGVFLAVQPAPWSRIVLAFRSVSSGRYNIRSFGFSTSGFHRIFATKPVCSETNEVIVLYSAGAERDATREGKCEQSFARRCKAVKTTEHRWESGCQR
jgi:hypothetical protein